MAEINAVFVLLDGGAADDHPAGEAEIGEEGEDFRGVGLLGHFDLLLDVVQDGSFGDVSYLWTWSGTRLRVVTFLCLHDLLDNLSSFVVVSV